MPNAEVTKICWITNILLKYNQHLNLMDNEVAVDLKLQNIKKYQRYIAQIADKLIYL